MAQGAPDNHITDELLSKYFAGEALPEEAMAIDAWRTSDAEHASTFRASWDAWNATSPKPYTLPDIQAVWKIIAASTKQKVRYLPWLAAASLLIAVSLLAAWLLTRPTPATQQTIIAAATQTTTQALPDGSVAKVAPGGEISYAEDFKGNTRTIHLKGNGDFDVKYDPDKPFEVTVGPIKITVLGTSFHVDESDSTITVKVSTGKVKMDKDGRSIIITAGQLGYYNKVTGKLYLETYHFAFDNETLGAITARLSIAFQKKITFKDPELAQLKTSSIFENKPLDYILEVVASTFNLKYTYLNSNEIYIEEE